jgi:nucleoside-diphosphate-sugar epimerase
VLEGKTFLVTGATGRLGSETVLRLEELGARVLPLALPGYPHEPKRVAWKARRRPIPICGLADLEDLEAPDYIINYHWAVDRTLSFADQLLFEISSNIHRPAFLWEWLRDKPLARFVNISSIKVYGPLTNGPVSSETEPRPDSPYGIAKLAAEHCFDVFFQSSGWQVTHLRLCSVASCGEHPSHLMSRLYESAFGERPFTLNRGNICSILYIDEAVDLVISAALTADRRRYLVMADPLAVGRMASMFEEISGKKVHALYAGEQPGIVERAFVSDRERLCATWTRIVPPERMIRLYIDARKQAESGTRSADPHLDRPEGEYHAKSS